MKYVDTIPPDPPPDAELPPRRRIRESWWPPLRILADHAHPVPWDPPANFPQPVALLQTRLVTSDEALADELLSDAERLFDEATASVDSIERRATTLQGGVAIAATVALTGGGLVLDPTKIHGDGWRTALALGLAALVLMLAMTALRALGATSRLGTFRTVSDEDIFARARMSNVADAKTNRAGYLLHAYGRNAEVAQVKVWYLKKAAFWFRGALLMLGIIVAMVCTYVVRAGSTSTKPGTTPMQGDPPVIAHHKSAASPARPPKVSRPRR